MRVLLVEDSDAVRLMFARVLELQGFLVQQAGDGRQALEALEHFRPDLMMPVMDGIELIRRVRAMPELADVPVVAPSAYAGPEAERLARDAGVVDFIAKPVEVPILLGRLSALGSRTGPTCA